MKKIIAPFLSLVLVGLLAGFTPDYSDGNYVVDTNASQLRWTGYHLAKSYEHNGFVKIKSGKFSVNDGKIISGEFIIDMNTITNSDLTSAKDNTKLVNHLKSNDFFNVAKFPEAKLVITKSEPAGSGLKVTGDLTIRGITKTIVFDATINDRGDNRIEATADLKIQRTDFQVMYGWKIENAILSGEFRMEVKLVGTR
ncbi:MAG: YceI family protein [Cyclobacteriaceae bacterium]